MAKRKSKPDPFNSQAAAEALIRYNPELTGLKELQQQARDTFSQRVHAGNATSAALQSVIDAAVPDVRQAFSESSTGVDAANALVRGDMAGLQGAGADRFRNALTTETTNFANLLSGARTNALTDLDRRKVAAAQGAKFSADQAGSDLASSLEKIGLRLSELGKESGAFQQQRIAELAGEQAKQDFTAEQNALGRRNSRLTAGVDAQGNVIPGGKADKPAKKPKRPLASEDKHIEVASQIQDIASRVGKYRDSGLSRSQIVNKLRTGRPQQVVYTDKDGNPVDSKVPGAIKVTLPSIPAYKADVVMSAALDVALDGHLSRKTQQKLQAHFKVSRLGVPTYGEWARKNRKRPSAATRKTVSDAARTVQRTFS